METKAGRLEKGSTLVRSVFLFVLGLLFITMGMNVLPVIGILIGAAFMGFAVYPWLSLVPLKRVKILVGAVSDNNLGPMRLPVAILSATEARDGFDFDPRQLNPASVIFGPDQARPIEDMSDPQIHRRNLVDVNGDGIPDLVLYYSGDQAGITASVNEACLRAKMLNGGGVYGCAAIDRGQESGLNEALEYR